jgi:cell division protein FtsI/penicillin-binding protein 2
VIVEETMTYRRSPLAGPGRRGSRRAAGPIAAVIVLVAVLAVGLVIWHPWSSATKSDAPAGATPAASASRVDQSARAFAAAWTNGDFADVTFADGVTPAAVKAQFDVITKDLQASAVQVTAGPAQRTSSTAASAPLRVSWTLPAGQRWSYDTTVDLERAGSAWVVRWQPGVVAPKLRPGDTLRYERTAPQRASILDGAGQPLMANRPVVEIGVEPSKTTDPAATAAALSTALARYGIDPTTLTSHIKAAPPTQFVAVITLRDPDFAPVADAVQAVPGVITRHAEQQLSPSHDFARALLGTVGPVTKEIVDASKGRYRAGDIAGLSGLEREYDAQLAGTPGYEIDIVHASSGGSTPLPTPLEVVRPTDGKPVRTTLDQRVQNAADSALSAVAGQPSALVAVQVSTGHLVAVANGPDGGGFDTALLGQLPPGSAFKVATTAALLERGLGVDTPVPCAPSVVVQGKSFHNYEGEAFGSVPFHLDFARSCNTAFISLAPRVGGTALPDAARSLGIGACWSLGTPAFRGSVPAPKSPVDLAAASFGQGSTLVSPASLAVAAGAIARGGDLDPSLVFDGAPAGCSASPSPDPLPPAVAGTLHSLMREVVTTGTATVLAAAPGGPVMAKTGTAEYGNGNPPKTHAWLVGYQGDLAFAVYVQDGSSGGTVAAPVALRFLRALATG